ncbi:hypothetical protein [Flavobacterium sp.]|uniref:hypothetical protein n=1 Tax=Flavobacterium sp. TaxID=239 RepID=UPI00286A53B6|nr:hypothetical protein [Flavobacterium sp.]
MKTSSRTDSQKSKADYASIFIAAMGISYALVSQIFYNKSNIELLVIMICLLSVGVTSKLKHNNESN